MDKTEIIKLAEGVKSGDRVSNAKVFLEQFPPETFARDRRKGVVETRRKIIKVLRDDFGLSFPEIAHLMNYGDHTSPMHLYNKKI